MYDLQLEPFFELLLGSMTMSSYNIVVSGSSWRFKFTSQDSHDWEMGSGRKHAVPELGRFQISYPIQVHVSHNMMPSYRKSTCTYRPLGTYDTLLCRQRVKPRNQDPAPHDVGDHHLTRYITPQIIRSLSLSHLSPYLSSSLLFSSLSLV
jgi:hypothetical protein